MIVLLIGLSIAACWAAAGTAVFIPAMLNAIIAFWANGVLANYRSDPRSAPNVAALLSMITIVGSLTLGVAGLILR